MSLISSLAVRREALAKKSKEDGFTLIELLVVVIIIGILAAIAIPIYIGVTNNAKDSAVQSDLTNAKTAVVASYTANNATFPAITAAALGSYGYTGSSVTNDTTGTATINAFCLKATSGSGNVFYITQGTVATQASSAPAGCN